MDERSTLTGDRPTEDPLRARLLDAAARVIAAKGYNDTRIMDVVREADLSAGALYGRFESKRDLLKAAVVEVTLSRVDSMRYDRNRIVDFTVQAAQQREPLTDRDAIRVEAFVEARRDDEVASAVRMAQRTRRGAVQPLVDAAVHGESNPEIEARVDAVLYALETLHLGILLQRSAGIGPADGANGDAWRSVATLMINALLDAVVADPGAEAST